MRPIKLTQKLFSLPEGGEERFHGFGIMGLTFESGHILALRHFPASSIGKGYTSVWHRRPDGTWDFYADVDPEISCTRYFSDQVSGIFIEPIIIKWIGNDYLRVEIKAADLNWIIRIESNFSTRIMNFCCRIIPDKW